MTLAMALLRECWHCHETFQAKRRTARYCEPAHYERARRRAAAGVPIDAFPEGACRGRVKMNELTARERAFNAGRKHERAYFEEQLAVRNLRLVASDVRAVTAELKGGR